MLQCRSPVFKKITENIFNCVGLIITTSHTPQDLFLHAVSKCNIDIYSKCNLYKHIMSLVVVPNIIMMKKYNWWHFTTHKAKKKLMSVRILLHSPSFYTEILKVLMKPFALETTLIDAYTASLYTQSLNEILQPNIFPGLCYSLPYSTVLYWGCVN